MTHYRLSSLLIALATSLSLSAQDPVQLQLAELNALYATSNHNRVSVHDPSVVHTTGDNFYLVGTMRGFARSTDHMQNWSGLNGDAIFGTVNGSGQVVSCSYEDAFSTNQTKTVRALVNGVVTEVPFGNFDAKSWAHADQVEWGLGGNMWAPDLIYNPTMQKWCMYQSINGDNWHSVIVLLTADDIMGPYVYQGPVHYSGFINGTNSAINWKKTDLELVIGAQSSLPSQYNKGGDWGTWWTNDIDPCTFFDEEGQLWMIYGSWSGGIFILKLDKTTGLRDYTVTYPTVNDNSGRALSDPYFGKRIAGGYYASGEGAYIKHIGQYYYLFVSYGGFAPGGYEMNQDGSYKLDKNGNKIPTGGYEMRTFRSATPDGVYLDATNHDACYHDRGWNNFGPNANTNGGMKLLGAYNGWGFQTVGECAQGHNSATVDAEGRAFVIYHTKFNDGMPQNGFHQVRVRQLFLNEDGWLCAAPFEYNGEEDTDASLAAGCRYTMEEMAGTYDVLIHKYKMNYAEFEEVTPVQIKLNASGIVSGALSGSWTLKDGTAYITLSAGGTTYKGVVVQQQVDGRKLKAIGITATAQNGVSLWAWRMEPQSAIAYTTKNYTMPVTSNTSVTKNLMFYGQDYYGANIIWESSAPDIIAPDGQYNPTDEATRVELTCHISCDNYTYDRTLTVTAAKAVTVAGEPLTGIAAYYDFEDSPARNLYNNTQSATFTRQGTATPIAKLLADPTRYGKVAQINAGDVKKNSFVRFPNPLKDQTGLTGFSVAVRLYREDDADLRGTLWSFTDNIPTNTSVKQRFFINGNATMHFQDDAAGTNSFDINALNDAGTNATKYIPAGKWVLLTVTVDAANGVSLYVDGVKKAHKYFTSTAGTAGTAAAAAKLFDYQHVLSMVTNASYFSFGHGDAAQGSPAARFDDLFIYDKALTADDVRGLQTLANRTTDFSPEGVGIEEVKNERVNSEEWDGAVYDLSGRRLYRTMPDSKLPRGLYIINGRKVMVR